MANNVVNVMMEWLACGVVRPGMAIIFTTDHNILDILIQLDICIYGLYEVSC